jgi:hypothetical protein
VGFSLELQNIMGKSADLRPQPMHITIILKIFRFNLLKMNNFCLCSFSAIIINRLRIIRTVRTAKCV